MVSILQDDQLDKTNEEWNVTRLFKIAYLTLNGQYPDILLRYSTRHLQLESHFRTSATLRNTIDVQFEECDVTWPVNVGHLLTRRHPKNTIHPRDFSSDILRFHISTGFEQQTFFLVLTVSHVADHDVKR